MYYEKNGNMTFFKQLYLRNNNQKKIELLIFFPIDDTSDWTKSDLIVVRLYRG